MPNNETYSLLLFQPEARITATTGFVGNADSGVANAKLRSFFQIARTESLCIATTPEYSCTWEVLEELTARENAPERGALWVIGCESTTPAELNELKLRVERTNEVVVLFEDPADQAGKTFLDPVCFLFRTTRVTGEEVIVCLVQFKMHPMADAQRLEQDNLIVGSTVYLFQNDANSLKLITLICSDVLLVRDYNDFAALARDTLVFHLQLNPSPRNDTFRQYRSSLFAMQSRSNEVICNNWAMPMAVAGANGTVGDPITGSAVYCRAQEIDKSDNRVNRNYGLGLHFTYWSEKYAYVNYLSPFEAVYQLRTTKPWQGATLAVQSRHTGPEMVATREWSGQQASWVFAAHPIDQSGAAAFNAYPGLQTVFAQYAADPVSLERLVSFSCGYVKELSNWAALDKLDSFLLDNSETIFRLTYAHDQMARAVEFRQGRLQRFSALIAILNDRTFTPFQLPDHTQGRRLQFDPTAPIQNLCSNAGDSRATIIYLGQNCSEKDLNEAHLRITEMLHRSSLRKDRLIVCYHLDGQLKIYKENERFRIDDPESDGPLSVTPQL